MSADEPLQMLRERIDALDDQIQSLISERARCAQLVAEVKQAGAGERVLYYRPEREAQILRRVRERNSGPLSDRAITHLFRELIAACLALEQPLTVAYPGPPGTFALAAAHKQFGRSVRTIVRPAVADVFREVEADSADFGVVPVENTLDEGADAALALLLHTEAGICGEVLLNNHLALISRAASLKEIERLYARQPTLLLCREWLDANLAQAERIAVASNDEAARRAARDSSSAAIAAEVAAEPFELPLLARNIEDDPAGHARFLVLGRQTVAPSGIDKTSLLIATGDTDFPHRLLAPLARHGVTLSRIESRPLRRERWTRVLHLDLLGHRDDPPLARALEEIGSGSDFVKILGSYPVDHAD